MNASPPSPAGSLRVAFVAPFGLRHKTTVWARTLPIAQQLVANGHQATILVPPWDSPQDAGTTEMREGVSVVQVNVRGGLLPTVRRLLQEIHRFQPHIVHIVKPRAHAGMVQWWLWQRRDNRPFKLVLDVDDWERAWNPVNRYGWFTARFLAWQEAWGIRHADAITAASRWLEAQAKSMAPSMPVLYLPNGVVSNGVVPVPEAEFAAPTGDPARPRILYFSRFVEVPPNWLRDFWVALLARLPTAELVVAGTPVQPWLAPPFHAALAGLPQVTWTGYIPSTDLPALYASTTCAIFPALPIPLLQAKCSVRLATTLLHGVPVVASAVGEHVHYGAEGAAHLVPADATPAMFAAAVAATIEQGRQEAQTRRTATLRMVERYSWALLVHPLPALYHSLLGQR